MVSIKCIICVRNYIDEMESFERNFREVRECSSAMGCRLEIGQDSVSLDWSAWGELL